MEKASAKMSYNIQGGLVVEGQINESDGGDASIYRIHVIEKPQLTSCLFSPLSKIFSNIEIVNNFTLC